MTHHLRIYMIMNEEEKGGERGLEFVADNGGDTIDLGGWVKEQTFFYIGKECIESVMIVNPVKSKSFSDGSLEIPDETGAKHMIPSGFNQVRSRLRLVKKK